MDFHEVIIKKKANYNGREEIYESVVSVKTQLWIKSKMLNAEMLGSMN